MDINERAEEALADAVREIKKAMNAWREALISAIEKLIRIANQIKPLYYLAYSNNSRVKHLALHSKKARVRKKNIHRLQREVMK